MELIEYAKCSTCKKAKKWLDDHHIEYSVRAIKEQTPTYEELNNWINKFNLPIKRLFNTSGLKYKELNLKEKLATMPKSDQIRLLASDGMLIKRPLLIANDMILIGFKENEWYDYFQ